MFIQKSLHDSGSSAPRECHNARKLPPLSHKPDVLLREVQVSIGNSSLCYSVKVLDPDTAAVHSCSESERSSGRCPPLLWHQETPSQSRSPWQEASITTLSSEVVFWIVSWGKPGGRWSHSLPGHCQSGCGWSCYDSRNLQMAHQTIGHPLFSEEARLVSNLNAQRSPLTMLTNSPVQVRFTLNSQSSQMKS